MFADAWPWAVLTCAGVVAAVFVVGAVEFFDVDFDCVEVLHG